MLKTVNISEIKITDRIRKDFGNIQELADDIEKNGLINPPVVTPDLVLIAGERRIRACSLLGWERIEVKIMTVRDYEHQLRLEISENENRKEFTFSERVEWARRLEQVEKLKAKERQAIIGSHNLGLEVENFPPLDKGKVRDKVAELVGFGSGKQYEKAKFIADHADPEIIQKLNEEKISINRAYQETKARLEAAERAKKEAEARVEAEKKRAEELAKRLQEAESAPPRVIEKIVEKPVVVEKKVNDPSLLAELEAVKQKLTEKEKALQELLSKQAKIRDFEAQVNKLSGEIANLLETKRKLEEANDEQERIRKRASEFHAALRRAMRPLQEEWGNLEFLLKQCTINAVDAAEIQAYIGQLRKIADTLEFHLSKAEGFFVMLNESGVPQAGRKTFEGVTVDVQPVRVGRA